MDPHLPRDLLGRSHGLSSWCGLVVAPSIALACQAVMYALVTPACSLQTRMGLHLVAAVSLALTLLLAWLAWRAWSALAGAAAQEDATVAPAATRRLLAAAATAVAGFSSLVIVAMWAGAWLLSPCDVWP